MCQFQSFNKFVLVAVCSASLLLLFSACSSNRLDLPSEGSEETASASLITVAQAPPPYVPGTPYWVPLIDECVIAGGGRIECIENLPPEVLADLERWEAANTAARRALMRDRLPAFGVVPQ